MAKQSIEDDIPTESFAEWVKTFFSGKKVISIDVKYNEASKAGFNKSENIHIRHETMVKHYEERFLANL